MRRTTRMADQTESRGLIVSTSGQAYTVFGVAITISIILAIAGIVLFVQRKPGLASLSFAAIFGVWFVATSVITGIAGT